MRGEDKVFCRQPLADKGSPPHARGRLSSDQPISAALRITPACAGKTAERARAHLPPQDHPRMRGEDGLLGVGVRVMGGSPPHARGRPVEAQRRQALARITPACAGKTAADERLLVGRDGSPPHARGRPRASGSRMTPTGITPACAGKTRMIASARMTLRDHPRMRGEDTGWASRRISPLGSPPHARGRRQGVRLRHRQGGITPACAGKTHAAPT
mgnify:CR=1 FL=1